MQAMGAREREADRGDPPGAGRRSAGRLIGCGLVISIAAVTLGLSAHTAVQTTAAQLTPAAISQAQRAELAEECTYHAIRAELPRGAGVYVPDYLDGSSKTLIDLQTLWSVPETDPARAQWTLSAGAGHACTRQALVVRRR